MHKRFQSVLQWTETLQITNLKNNWRVFLVEFSQYNNKKKLHCTDKFSLLNCIVLIYVAKPNLVVK